LLESYALVRLKVDMLIESEKKVKKESPGFDRGFLLIGI
jgi:hypothetical protein